MRKNYRKSISSFEALRPLLSACSNRVRKFRTVLPNLRTRLTEHAKLNTSAVSEHLTTCEHARHIADLHNLYDNVNDLNPDKPFSDYELITNNTKILQSLQHTNSNILLFLEALHIKFKRPALNNGLKASKELMLFCG